MNLRRSETFRHASHYEEFKVLQTCAGHVEEMRVLQACTVTFEKFSVFQACELECAKRSGAVGCDFPPLCCSVVSSLSCAVALVS